MATRRPKAAEILALLEEDDAAPALTVREIAVRLGLPKGMRPAIRRVLADLVDEGRVVAMRGRRFGPRASLGDLVGRYTRHRAGFGFVNADDPGEEDLFIPPDAQGDAIHGDVVAAKVVNVRPDGKREGRVVRVVESKTRSLVGVLQQTYSGAGLVEPLDAGFGFEVLVPKGETAKARTGEAVRIELETMPGGGKPGRGRVVERLGRPEDPGVDVEVLIRKYDLEPEFPADVAAEARALPSDPAKWSLKGREDFTGQAAVTIDGKTAKDFDDAVFVERLKGGGYRLLVHIADVAHFVAPGSALDQEALRRGTSVYFPGRVVPMLPEELSNDLCSLRPKQIRLTRGVAIEYDERGRETKSRFFDGVIRSRARLTYTEVTAIVEGRDAAARRERSELVPMLDTAAELARLLLARRQQRGVIDFDLPEPELIIALTGETEDIVSRPRQLAHQLIEVFMIAANEAVAAELVKRRRATLYRVHEKPPADRQKQLAEALAGLGYSVPALEEGLRPRDLAAIVEQARGRPEEAAVSRLVLRSMALARYDEECLGHFGLALKRYLHFTSPIRRYPDLVVHRSLRALIRGEEGTPGERSEEKARLPELARECSRLEREAEAAERESISWKVAAFMADRLGDEFRARVVDIAQHGVTVLLDEPYVEGLIPIRRLGEEYFRYDSRRRMLVGSESGRRFRLGEELMVRLDRVDLQRHFIDFSPADAQERSRGDRRGRPGRRSKKTGVRGEKPGTRSKKPGTRSKKTGTGSKKAGTRSGKPRSRR